jgi:hypothetical protein
MASTRRRVQDEVRGITRHSRPKSQFAKGLRRKVGLVHQSGDLGDTEWTRKKTLIWIFGKNLCGGKWLRRRGLTHRRGEQQVIFGHPAVAGAHVAIGERPTDSGESRGGGASVVGRSVKFGLSNEGEANG